jgi:hypothetical protein
MLLNPLCTAREFSDASNLVSNHYREPQHGVAEASMLLDPLCTAREFSDASNLVSNHYRDPQHGVAEGIR